MDTTSKIDPKSFLKKYQIKEESFQNTGLSWDELNAIASDFDAEKIAMEEIAKLIANSLMKSPDAHSVRFRVKDTEHLIEKIIRKKIEIPDRIIALNNYKEEITDLIGIRILHLFKESWTSIYNYILDNWSLKEDPIAYIREGDNDIYNNEDKKFTLKPHPFGYRSLHFIIESKPSKKNYYIEIQVRTIFEEGWSEIDHKIRYPYEMNNPIYGQFLLILNRLAGSADEMGSFIKALKGSIHEMNSKIEERDKKIIELENKIKNSKLDKLEKTEITKDLNLLKEDNFYSLIKPNNSLRDFLLMSTTASALGLPILPKNSLAQTLERLGVTDPYSLTISKKKED